MGKALITPEHFELDRDPSPLRAPPLTELELAIERAIESGSPVALDAAAAAIELLDRLEPDPDVEQDDWNEREEIAVAAYGVDQTDNAAFKKPPILLFPMCEVEKQFDWWTSESLRLASPIGSW